MAYFDMPLEELQRYTPPSTRQPDFEEFWLESLAKLVDMPHHEFLNHWNLPYRGYRFFQLSYAGWRANTVKGTLAMPKGDGPFPGVVLYHGYSSSRPDPFELLGWVSQGYAVLAIDIRAKSGQSGDFSIYPDGQVVGYLTKGITNRQDYYYLGAYMDCLLALDRLAAHPQVDSNRIGVAGCSQGGGISLAVAALCALRREHLDHTAPSVAAVVAEIPFLCHFERAATLVDTAPYREIADYCRKLQGDSAFVFHTLSYFDVMNLAAYTHAPTLVTVGLMDMVCPPSTVFAAYHALKGKKEIIVAPFGEHETFPGVLEARMRWFHQFVT